MTAKRSIATAAPVSGSELPITSCSNLKDARGRGTLEKKKRDAVKIEVDLLQLLRSNEFY